MRTCLAMSLLAACTASPMTVPDAGAEVDASVDARGPVTSWCDGGARPGDAIACNETSASTTVITGPGGPFNVVYETHTMSLHACGPMRVRLCNELVETSDFSGPVSSATSETCTETIVLSDNARIQCGSTHTTYGTDGTAALHTVRQTWTAIAIEWL